jgi:glyoxylase-like metal-dependent hydrolase (beta-lactamase superfamily II)
MLLQRKSGAIMTRLIRALSLLVVASSAGAQVNLDTVQVRTTHVAGSVYMLQGSGGNIGLAVGDDAVFVVDDQFAPLTRKILAAIAEITPKPVKFVINTHWHSDHTGGNENLGQAGAVIYAHDNVRKRMTTGGFIEALNATVAPSSPAALPVITFTDAVTFHINGDSVTVTHVPPAHTDGDAIIYFTKANVVHMGDTFHNAGLPFADLTSGGSLNGFITAADKVLAMTNAQTKIIATSGLAQCDHRPAGPDSHVDFNRQDGGADHRAQHRRSIREGLAGRARAVRPDDAPGTHQTALGRQMEDRTKF